MADTTLTSVPAQTYAGDTLNLLIALSDYPAGDGWGLAYAFRKENGTQIDFSSTASGNSHLFQLTASTTAQWLPGIYLGTAKVTLSAEVYTVWRGNLEILPDLAQQVDNFETRTANKIVLDAINAVLLGKASRDILNTTIAGQSIGRMTWTELLAAKSYYQDLVDGEVAAANAANGLGNSRNILVRFGNP